MHFKNVLGTVIKGHGVASGQGGDPRFPKGTIQMQKPAFAKQGLNLDHYFPGTINVSIHPHQYIVQQAKYTFRQVQWTENAPPEDFSFFDCRVSLPHDRQLIGLIYYPHPETKPEHFQDPTTLEVLTEFVDDLTYGMSLELSLDPNQLLIVNQNETP